MFNKKNFNIPRPIHQDIKEQKFPDISGMDLNIPSYNPIVSETPRVSDYPKRGYYHKQEVHESPKKGYFNKRDTFEQPVFARPSTRNIVKDNTLFVKIDKYQESMRTLNLIKESLMSTEHILNKLQQIKSQEDNEIQQWHEQIKRIKQKIVFIDKNLFEQ
jgi:glutamate synthase domain-containing protein 2